jgi:hypothetical protein
MFGKLGTRISSAEHDEDIRPRERNFMIHMIGRSLQRKKVHRRSRGSPVFVLARNRQSNRLGFER